MRTSDIQAGFRKGRGTRDQMANIQWIIEKAREFPPPPKKKNPLLLHCYNKASDCVDHDKLENS